MDPDVLAALALTPQSSAWDRTIEITTRGARSGLARRIEIWLYRVDETNYLTGMPGPTTDWSRNLEANPQFLFHLKHGVQATLKATAHAVTDPAERFRVFSAIVADLNQSANPGRIRQPTSEKAWMDGSVLFEIEFDIGGD
ncbi:MAG: nitroreductase family deazaflavin-dependent oxidoreductase [Salinibacterium sp.]|nr:nitroreductase family deazaflavin-dependent oxidoreductase [Salinibacterium sp.]